MFRRTTVAVAVLISCSTASRITCYFFSSTSNSNFPKPFSKIPWRYRPQAIQESQQVLTEYLNMIRSVPFLYAGHRQKFSSLSLGDRVQDPLFARSVRRFFRYHPVNELNFLCESIGLSSYKTGLPRSLFPPNTFFLYDWKQFDVICALAAIGFPWSKLGMLCKGGSFSIFETEPSQMQRRISEIKDDYGFNSVCVIGICLAFPRVFRTDSDGLLTDLKTVFLDHDLLPFVEGNIDAVLDVCEKIKLFYDLGCEMGKVGELIGRSKIIFRVLERGVD